jgi:hypothetical protein
MKNNGKNDAQKGKNVIYLNRSNTWLLQSTVIKITLLKIMHLVIKISRKSNFSLGFLLI